MQHWKSIKSAEPVPILAFALGIALPLVSLLLFPNYANSMPEVWLERSRILELQYLFFELAVMEWASRTGFLRKKAFLEAPFSIRLAMIAIIGSGLTSSILVSEIPFDSILQTLIVLVHFVFFGAVLHLLKSAPVASESFLEMLGLGMVVLLILTFVRFSFPPLPSTVPGGEIDWTFATPGFVSVRYFGLWAGMAALMFAITILHRNEDRNRLIFGVFYVLAASMALWSGTRSAVFGMVMGYAAFILVVRKLPGLKRIAWAIGLTVLAAVLAYIFRWDQDSDFQILRRLDPNDINNLTTGRASLWMRSLKEWWASPLVGTGTGSMVARPWFGWHQTQPHNSIVQFLQSWGTIGACGALWLLFCGLRTVSAKAREVPSLWPILAMIYALVAMSMFDGTLYYPRFIIMVALGMAMIIAWRDNGEASHDAE